MAAMGVRNGMAVPTQQRSDKPTTRAEVGYCRGHNVIGP
jgi:hypothetical protein